MTYSGQRGRIAPTIVGIPSECTALNAQGHCPVESGTMVAMTRVSLRLAVPLALVVLAALTAPADAKKTQKYYFELTRVDLVEGIPDKVRDRVRTVMLAELGQHESIITELPAGAPDPEANPKKFKVYLKKRGIRAFKVNVEVTEYSREVKDMEDGSTDKRLKVSIALRTFGETIPDRVMAFAGQGSAAIQLEVGKKVRDRDDEVAHKEAFEPAVSDAVAESLRKLSMPPAKPGKKAHKRKKKRNKK